MRVFGGGKADCADTESTLCIRCRQAKARWVDLCDFCLTEEMDLNRALSVFCEDYHRKLKDLYARKTPRPKKNKEILIFIMVVSWSLYIFGAVLIIKGLISHQFVFSVYVLILFVVSAILFFVVEKIKRLN